MAKVTKVMRYALAWSGDEATVGADYNKICEILWKLSDETRAISNRTVRLWWQWDSEMNDEYNRTGIRPSFKEKYGKAQSTLAYQSIAHEQEYCISTDTIASLTNDICGRMNKMRQELWKGARSIVSYRENQPILVVKKAIRYEQNQSGYQFRFSLLSRAGLKYFGFKEFNPKLKNTDIFQFIVVGKLSASARTILRRCADKRYTIGASKLIYDKRKKQWFLNLTYSFEAEENTDLDENRILGVDLGLVHAVHMAVSDVEWDGRRFTIEGGEITDFRRQVEKRRRSLQTQIRTSGDGRTGHGRNRALQPLEKLSDKERNFRNTTNFRYAKRIVDTALEYKCGIIQMESLDGITKDNSFLQQNWTFYDLQTKIKNKAAEHGIKVLSVEPKYTSQRCHVCGCICSDNRLKQAVFICQECGYKGNADFNAAKNLATRDIDRIIKETMKHHSAKKKQTEKV